MKFLTKIEARTILRVIYCTKASKERRVDGYTNNILVPGRESIEHVVPKCHLPRSRWWDLHNLLLIDTKINNDRSNTKFGEMTYKGTSFCPSNPASKGTVARICLHMFDTCTPLLKKKNDIISDELLLEWDMEYPPSDTEKYANEFIYEVQGTYNKFII